MSLFLSLSHRYGLGSIYFRQEKYELAEYHFARALAINDQSSVRGGVLHLCINVVHLRPCVCKS